MSRLDDKLNALLGLAPVQLKETWSSMEGPPRHLFHLPC